MKQRYAIIVGVNNYVDKEHFIPSSQAPSGAKALYDLLVDPQRGGWLPEHVFLLTGETATREELESHLWDTLLIRAQPDDLVLFYFAGYAFLDRATHDGYLALQTSLLEQPITSLHVPTIVDHYIHNARAGDVLTLLDITLERQNGLQAEQLRSAAPVDAGMLFGDALLDLPKTRGRVALASCRLGALTQKQAEGEETPFTTCLLKALSGQAANPRTGRVTLGTLYDYLDERIPRGDPSYPQKLGHEYGSMVLIERPEWKSWVCGAAEAQ